MVKIILDIIGSEAFNFYLGLYMDHSVKLGNNMIEFIFRL